MATSEPQKYVINKIPVFRYSKKCNTVVWEKFMVINIREKKIRGKKFSSMQAIDENFLTPNISYMHILTCTLNYHLLFFLS